MNRWIKLALFCVICSTSFISCAILIAILGAPGWASAAGLLGAILPIAAQYVWGEFQKVERKQAELEKSFDDLKDKFDVRCDLLDKESSASYHIAKQSLAEVTKQRESMGQIQSATFSAMADAQRATKSTNVALDIAKYLQNRVDKNSAAIIKVRFKLTLMKRRLK